MKLSFKNILKICLISLVLVACSSDDDTPAPTTEPLEFSDDDSAGLIASIINSDINTLVEEVEGIVDDPDASESGKSSTQKSGKKNCNTPYEIINEKKRNGIFVDYDFTTTHSYSYTCGEPVIFTADIDKTGSFETIRLEATGTMTGDYSFELATLGSPGYELNAEFQTTRSLRRKLVDTEGLSVTSSIDLENLRVDIAGGLIDDGSGIVEVDITGPAGNTYTFRAGITFEGEAATVIINNKTYTVTVSTGVYTGG